MRNPTGIVLLLGASFLIGGCLDTVPSPEIEQDSRFPLLPHNLLPVMEGWDGVEEAQIAAGKVTGTQAALEQPIPFPHYTHATKLEMQCEYCHSEARQVHPRRRTAHADVHELPQLREEGQPHHPEGEGGLRRG